jgi:hypothetical protein
MISAIIYILLFFARDQDSTFFLVQYMEHFKFLSAGLLVVSGVVYVLKLLFGGVEELSGKKCVRCNRPALKGFIYCHEHLQKANEDMNAGRRVASGRR